MTLHKIVFTVLFSFIGTILFGQYSVSGIISDEVGSPIPFAKVFVKNDASLRTIADINGYYEMRIYQGEYYFVISSSGFTTKEIYITVNETDQTKNISLIPIKVQDINDVNVSAKKSNPGREIMLKVVEKRNEISPWS